MCKLLPVLLEVVLIEMPVQALQPLNVPERLVLAEELQGSEGPQGQLRGDCLVHMDLQGWPHVSHDEYGAEGALEVVGDRQRTHHSLLHFSSANQER